MNINDLRHIGKKLMTELPALGNAVIMKTPVRTGAGGDVTFPVDQKAEDIIIAGLESIGDPLTIISEEAGILDIQGGGNRVVIDPIDGSKNAISGIPFYCASIAVAAGDTLADITHVYIINLISGDEFWAEKGSGAFLNGRPIHTQKDDIFYLSAYESQSPGRDIAAVYSLLSVSRKTRCLGSTALDLAYLSLGAISVFVCPAPSRSFDFAGGWLLVREAGGIITDTCGKDISNVHLNLERNSALLASGNINLHEKAIELLSQKNNSV